MFLHTPHRMASLGMIYCMALVIHTNIQRTIRIFLKENCMKLRYHKGITSDNITARFVYELMAGILTVSVVLPDGSRVRTTTEFKGWQQLAAQALGTPAKAFMPVM